MKQRYGWDFGKTKKRKTEIIELAKQYKIKYSLIEPNLKNGFKYKEDCYDAIFIIKKIDMKKFKEEEFEKDLKYITDLYKAYETRFENATILATESKKIASSSKSTITNEEINERMLALIEEVGNLARELKERKAE